MRNLSRRRVGGPALASLLILAPLAAWSAEPGSAQSPGQPETRLVGVVNVNTATPEQLELLPGVGPVRARAIIEYRKAHGAFGTVEDLARVSGIGPLALERVRQHCAVEGKTTARLEP